ncbi:hypothetical protein QBC32DRAFT_93191 [Pseudoneurospora amorphoporcata]|uniref:Uncharacterized protein n=1 Tax=Pseudoneurospora amorphoporcata TaxID=241081 RepID=A0AAN6NYB7_9PEZI|nr:hypothetical protein QBC32DRAFT_93191 [Pseudoneurospora amorphoporcata]
MFFKTKPLGSLKSILPPIHQPLPLNQRESQKLLDVLKASFRAHLDKEHGWTPDTNQVAPAAPTVTYLPSSSSKDVPARPTDKHMRAILENPLFNNKAFVPPSVAAAAAASVRNNRNDVFQLAVSKGIMNTQRALGFLLAVQRDIQLSAAVSVGQGMKESGAGLLVLRWLRSSGEERSLGFLGNRTFTRLLLRYMVAEGLDELAWSWFHRLLNEPALTTGSPERAAYPAALLDGLIMAKSQAIELDEAYTSMLRGKEVIADTSASTQHLVHAWSRLCWHTTGESYKHQIPATSLFESFVAVHDELPKPFPMAVAHLMLYHPTKPSPALALKYLKNGYVWNTKLPSYRADKPDAKFPTKLASLTLDTIENLMQNGEFAKAQRLMERFKTHLAPMGPHYGAVAF